MPGVVALRDAISSDVVTSLATAGYPALTDGKILLGRQFQYEQSAPPRIIFIPTASDFPAKDVYSRAQGGSGYTAEQLAQNRNPSVLTDMFTFEVRCWGASADQDPDDDYDYTQTLYQQVIRSCDSLARGTYKVSGGKWTDATFQSAQLVRDGREFVFNLTFGTPILALLEALPLAPSEVSANPTTIMQLPTLETSVGCSG